jgi:hypothetical protein
MSGFEILGGTASVIAIADVAAKIAKVSIELYKILKDAPAELAGVKDQLVQLNHILDLIHAMQNAKTSLMLSQHVLDLLEAGLKDTEAAISDFRNVCRNIPCSGKRATIRWAFLDRLEVKKHEEHLSRSISRVLLFLQLVNP